MKKDKKRPVFVLCIRNEGCDDLEVRKAYRRLEDRQAAKDRHVRIIDESGEDYLYPEDYFVPMKLPASVSGLLLRGRGNALQPSTSVTIGRIKPKRRSTDLPPGSENTGAAARTGRKRSLRRSSAAV